MRAVMATTKSSSAVERDPASAGGRASEPATNREAADQPTLDEIIRWIRQDLDARPAPRRVDASARAQRSVGGERFGPAALVLRRLHNGVARLRSRAARQLG